MRKESKDELEIRSTHLDHDEVMSAMQNADKRAVSMAETVIRLNKQLTELQTKSEMTKTDGKEMLEIEKALEEAHCEYKATVNQTLNLAEMISFDVKDLEYRKVDIDKYFKVNANTDVRTAIRDIKEESLIQLAVVGEDKKNKKNAKVFLCNNVNATKKFPGQDDDADSNCSCCGGESSVDTTKNPKKIKSQVNVSKSNCERQTTNKIIVDMEREHVRDDLMTMKGQVKILLQQNRDLLVKLNNANQRTFVLSKALRDKIPMPQCKEEGTDDVTAKDKTAQKSKIETLMNEIDRLRCELKEVNRDRCQIELAKKVLNISDVQCANCMGMPENDVQCNLKLKQLTEDYKRLLSENEAKTAEIMECRIKLDQCKFEFKTYEERLIMTKTQVAQLEKQLFDLNSSKANDPQLEHSNEKYLIENLRHQLQVAIDEKTNLQMVMDCHLTELEDKKSKYLAVLQTNQEQKLRLEDMHKEKLAIATEYEAEFNRMKEHFNQSLEEVKSLPGQLASLQMELEKEMCLKKELETERNNYVSELESLKKLSKLEDHSYNAEQYKALEEENRQLKATVLTLEDALCVNKQQYKERMHYSLQLKEQLDTVREEAAIQVTKIKDFSECQRLKFVHEIQKLENQLAETRAIACNEFKRRDNIDERMRLRMETLMANLDVAHKQIKELQHTRKYMEFDPRDICKVPRSTEYASSLDVL